MGSGWAVSGNGVCKRRSWSPWRFQLVIGGCGFGGGRGERGVIRECSAEASEGAGPLEGTKWRKLPLVFGAVSCDANNTSSGLQYKNASYIYKHPNSSVADST